MEDNKTCNICHSKFIIPAIYSSIYKLNPIGMLRNPVMFVVEIGAFVTTLITIYNIFKGHSFGFNFQISVWLWFTVIFANFAEAIAEARGKAQGAGPRPKP